MNAERLLALYEQIADAPDAIARLRRFILDLAVRGKLVPQSSGDETASKFLERITNSDQVTKGKKSGKAHKATTGLVDPPFDLPATWTWCAFGEVHQLIRGVTYSKSDVSEGPRAGYVPVLRANNIGASLTHDEPVYVKRSCVSEDQFLKAGDFMIALSSGSKNLVGKAAFVPEDYHEAFGGFCGVIRLFDRSLQGLVRIFLQSGLYRQSISAGSRGIGINNLKKEALSNLFFPLPPLAEQDRIVAKVDELMALCDQLEKSRTAREETRDRLTAASLARLTDPASETFHTDARFALDALPSMTARPDQIKQLRQTILNLAVRGKLVSQNTGDEPASSLLKKVASLRASRVALGELRLPKKALKQDVSSKLFDIPYGWAWAVANDLWDFENGDRSKNYPSRDQFVDNGVPFINAGHLVGGRVDLANMNYISPSKFDQLGGGKLRRGDQVYCLRGSLGKHALFLHNSEAAIASSLVILRPIDHEIVPFLSIYLDSDIAQTMLKRFDNGSAQPNLSSANLRNYEIPLPPLAEQHRIVAKVDELMALCDRLESSLAVGETTRSRLLEALLHEALVPSVDRLEAAA